MNEFDIKIEVRVPGDSIQLAKGVVGQLMQIASEKQGMGVASVHEYTDMTYDDETAFWVGSKVRWSRRENGGIPLA